MPSPPPVAREFRAVWMSPVSDGRFSDWPSAPGLPADSQKKELCALLDRAKATGLNVVILHVRTAGDALYRSSDVPWSAFLTGTSGEDPGYDPLAYAISQAHARGLQLHAWFNPFRAMLPNFKGRAAANHVTRTHPEWIRQYGSQTWIDPGIPEARQAVLDAIVDVVKRYDVDGVHIDDYFYPYRESETITKRVGRKKVHVRQDIPFPDEKSWERYGRGWPDRAAWRRANVDDFVHNMYTEVKAAKPWVVVGISPFGIWRSGTPAGITGLDAFSEIYADSRRWLQEGWLDYFVPQLYWPIDGDQRRFTVLNAWWHTQNPHDRYIWPGLATMNIRQGRWNWSEIARQITTLRSRDVTDSSVTGHVHFRIGSLTANGGTYAEQLAHSLYATDVLVPAFPWCGLQPPPAPTVKQIDGLVEPRRVLRTITMAPSDTTSVVWWVVQRQVIGGWKTALLRANAVDTATVFDLAIDSTARHPVAIRAVGRTGLLSPITWVQ